MLINGLTIGTAATPTAASTASGNIAAQTSFVNYSASPALFVSQTSGFNRSYENKLLINSAANNIAKNISVADQAIAQKIEALEQIKNRLTAALREFEYQPLKNAKLELFGDYVALRMLMVRDTIPPEFEFAWKITTEDADQQITIVPGGPSVTVRSQSMIAGGDSRINIPETPLTKEQISAAIQTIDRTQQIISWKRTSLASDASAVADTLAQTIKSSDDYLSQLAPDINIKEPEAEEKSREIALTIPANKNVGITGDNSEALRTFL